jgi:hypothetical protein
MARDTVQLEREVVLSVESSADSHTLEPTMHIVSEGVIREPSDTVLALHGASLDDVRFLLRGALATEAIDVDLSTPPATLTLVPGAAAAPPSAFRIADVLWLWRAAERLLETVDVGSPEYEATVADLADLRTEYQRLFEARQREG